MKLPASLLKKRLQHRCFPVNFAEILKILFNRTYLEDCFRVWHVTNLKNDGINYSKFLAPYQYLFKSPEALLFYFFRGGHWQGIG